MKIKFLVNSKGLTPFRPLKGCDDGLVVVKPLLRVVDDWRKFLAGGVSEEEYSVLRKHERTGRPLGSKRFIGQLEQKLGRVLRPQKGGRPKKQKN